MLPLTSIIHNAPLWRTAWRRILRRPFQYLMVIVGVALGVAMMVSIDLANGSASRAFALSTDAIAGRTTHRIVGGADGLDESIYTRLRTELGYRRSAPIIDAMVSSAELGPQPYQLVGIDPFAEPPFRSYFGEGSGENVANLSLFMSKKNGVILSADVAKQYQLDVGKVITLEIAGHTESASIVALVESADELTRRGLEGLIFTDIASAQEMTQQTGKIGRIDLIIDDEKTIAEIQKILPPSAQIETAAARSNALRQMTAAFELNLSALSLLALVVGIFLIYNTITFSVVQRRPLFGVLRCLGVTGQQLATLILSEALVLGLIGALIGVGLGILLGQSMVRLVTQTINDLYFTVTVRSITIPPITLIKGVVVGVLASMLASALPAWEAWQTPPSNSLRRSNLESRVYRFLPWLVVGWVVLGAFGAFLLWLKWGGLYTAFGGLFIILFAFALVTPPLTVGLMKLFSPIGSYFIGAIGRMAPRDIIRSLSRTSVAVAALMIAVSVIVGVSIMIGSFRRTVVQWLDQTLQADIYISPPSVSINTLDGVLNSEIVAQASQWQGVTEAYTARIVPAFAPDWKQTISLNAISGDISRGNRSYLWVDGDQSTLWQRFLGGEGFIISEPLIHHFGITTPPIAPITLMTDQGEKSLPILAVVYDYGSDQGTVFIGEQLYREWWDDQGISTLALFVKDSAEIDSIINQMQTQFTALQKVNIRSNNALRTTSIEVFDRTFAITDALRLLATVVAFIGVLSALMSLQLERTRELGTLRATGMTQIQLWQLTLLETGLMGGVAGLLAMPTGYVLAWILIHVINLRSFGWTLQIYLIPDYFLQAFLIAVFAALLAGVYPAYQLGRMIIATAIRSD